MNRHSGTGDEVVRGPFPLVLFALSLFAILWICIRPAAGPGATGVRLCLLCGDEGVPNFVLNMLLYAPLGLAVGLRTGSAARAVVLGFLLSIMVETVQLWVPGRFTALADLASNTMGAGLGGMLSQRFRTIVNPPPHRRKSMTLGWVAALSMAAVLPGALLVPSVPEDVLYVGWTPSLGSLERYSGRVLSVQLDTLQLTHGLVERPRDVGPLLASGAELDIRFQVGDRPLRLAPLLHLSTESQSEVLLVGIQSRTLIVRPRVRARDIRLAAPEFRFDGLLDQVERGDTVVLSIQLHPTRGPEVTFAGSVFGSGMSADRGWSLLRYPRRWPDWAFALLDVLWTMMWFLPIGLWSSSTRLLITAAAFPTSLALLVCVWTPLQPPHMLHAAAAVAGLLAGRGLRLAAPHLVPAPRVSPREDPPSSTPASDFT